MKETWYNTHMGKNSKIYTFYKECIRDAGFEIPMAIVVFAGVLSAGIYSTSFVIGLVSSFLMGGLVMSVILYVGYKAGREMEKIDQSRKTKEMTHE